MESTGATTSQNSKHSIERLLGINQEGSYETNEKQKAKSSLSFGKKVKKKRFPFNGE